MTKKLAFLHAHHSNIDYIEKALAPYDVVCVHFVDPGLLRRIASDEPFTTLHAQQKVNEQLQWIAKCDVDAIVITCTHYIALLQQHKLSIPIIKIDEPFFDVIRKTTKPQTILFTNPATVEGTMASLYDYIKDEQMLLDIEAVTIPHTFELIMQGSKTEYDDRILHFLHTIAHEKRTMAVAQLSMVDAATTFERATVISVVNPLDTLISSLISTLFIEKKNM